MVGMTAKICTLLALVSIALLASRGTTRPGDHANGPGRGRLGRGRHGEPHHRSTRRY
jgi:hypothetical protein